MSTAIAWRNGLSKANCEALEKITEKVRGCLGRAIEPLYLAGCELKKARELLGDEQPWIAWLEAEFKPGFRTTAWRLITLAERLHKPYQKGLLLQFATSAAYELTAPGAPPEALERAVEEAEEGATITHTRAKELVAEQREEEAAAAEEAVAKLPPEVQKRIRRAAREKAIRDKRAAKLATIERHGAGLRAAMEEEPEIDAENLDKLDEVLEACRAALG